jgi:hypothetical protein
LWTDIHFHGARGLFHNSYKFTLPFHHNPTNAHASEKKHSLPLSTTDPRSY